MSESPALFRTGARESPDVHSPSRGSRDEYPPPPILDAFWSGFGPTPYAY